MKFFLYLFAYSPITIFVHIFENFLYSKVSVNLYKYLINYRKIIWKNIS